MSKDNLGSRMKDYEARNQYFLQRKIPVAIRVDMKAGHSFTKGFEKPFDKLFMKTMQDTMLYCCKNIENCVFAYAQSDEITFILMDDKTINTESWFNYRTDKLCSITASMATMAFNKYFFENLNEDDEKYEVYTNAIMNKPALFDARCFNVPKEEVCNLIYWRQLDATRNSIQMVGQAYFSQKELHKQSCDKIQDMLFKKHSINWNDFPVMCKRGTACRKIKQKMNITGTIEEIAYWEIDYDIPILKGENRNYIEDIVYRVKE